MCLLIAVFRRNSRAPLVVAANRDERYDRPASPAQVLRPVPRTIGGRDELAGGTWLTVNEHGVVAGLTNAALGGRRDPAKRSRGELPILLSGQRTATEAVAAFEKQVDPRAFNPCWLLVADRSSCFYLDVSTGALEIDELDPGVVVLENQPLGAPSAKVDRVLHLLERIDTDTETGAGLATILADHAGAPTSSAPCVHRPLGGTRSSMLVTLFADRDRPEVRYADGPPCTSAFVDVTGLFDGSARLDREVDESTRAPSRWRTPD